LGIGTPLIGRLLLVDALDARVREVRVTRDPACPLCGDAPVITDVGSTREAVIAPRRVAQLAARDLDALLAADPAAVVLDVRDPHERSLGSLPGALEIPASELESRLHELDTARTYVVACRVGAKSRWAAERLYDAGFRKLYHLADGLLAYAAIDAGFETF
jgi:adenylyltransferase/sulfurtransferase